MIEYKTFEPVYFKDADKYFDDLRQVFGQMGQNSYVGMSLCDLKEAYEEWKEGDPQWALALKSAEENILNQCPNLNEDEQFLLLLWW